MNGGTEATRRGENGEKGAIVAKITPEETSARLVPLGGCRAFEAKLEDRGENEVLAELVRLCPFRPESTMVSLTLTGAPLSDTGRLSELAKDFLSFRLSDCRISPREKRSGKSLCAMFLRKAEEKGLSDLATAFGLAALENREQPRANGRFDDR